MSQLFTGSVLVVALLAGALRCLAADGNTTVATPAPSGAVPALAPRTVPGIDLTLLPIPAGSFTMGSPSYKPGSLVEGPQTKVTITKAFWLGKYAVTQGQWKSLMGTDVVEQARRMLADDTLYPIKGKQQTMEEFLGVTKGGGPKAPAEDTLAAFTRTHHTIRDSLGVPKDSDPKALVLIDKVGNDDPIYWVNWEEAVAYCRKLTERERSAGRLPAGYEYRLPTDAEWEYACSIRTMRPIYLNRNSSIRYTETGGTQNPWGLYDMLDDMGQWCGDWYAELPGGNVTDPHGPEKGSERVNHCGKWRSNRGVTMRAAIRSQAEPGYRYSSLGFRVALAPSLP